MGRVMAVVAAAGEGRRFGGKKPFVSLLGKPVLLWALEALEASGAVDEIIPVLRPDDMAEGGRLIESSGIRKVRKIAPGGRERQDSVMNALGLIEDDACTVLVHDGARPLLRQSLIADLLQALSGHDGAVAGVPPKDTIKEADGQGLVGRTLRREALWAVQTPQVFPFGKLMEAYRAAGREGYYSTDDSALVERLGGKVKIVMGHYENLKITTPEDLLLAEAILRRAQAA